MVIMKIFSITGWSGGGKTTLITRLVQCFKTTGKRIAAVKNTPHKYYLEPESADTFKFLESGADEVFLTAQHQLISLHKTENIPDIIQFIQARSGGCDYLLLEGLRRPGIPMIEVFDSSQQEQLKFPLNTLTAVISDKPLPHMGNTPCFLRDDIAAVMSFMELYGE